jgi:hypothetical protein
MNDNKNYMLITEFSIKPELISSCVHSWKKLYEGVCDRVLYRKSDKNALLEIVLLDKPASIENEISSTLRNSYADLVKPALLTDWRMQLLGLKNKVIMKNGLLPSTNYLQLRYIEVPLSVYDEYFQWRRNSIFKYIEKFSNIEYFMAYHSVLSTKPGVLFLSGFLDNVDEYLSVFSRDEFQKISNEAKEKFIYGGDQGLSTVLYEKV